MRREPVFDDTAYDMADGPSLDDLRPLSAPKPFGRARLMAQFACGAAMIAGLTLAARDRSDTGRPAHVWTEPRHAESVAKVRTAVPASPAILTIDAGSMEQAVRVESPHWSAATGRREDGLAQGQFDMIEAPYLRITVGETAAAEPNPSLFVTLARRAADLRGLAVTKTSARGALDTKFGAFETVEMTLQGEGSRSCTGFQSVGSASIRIDGWLCGILGQAPEPNALVCSIDRLRLTGPAIGSLDAAFSEAERRRASSCEAASLATTEKGKDDATGSIAREKSVRKARTKKSEANSRQTTQAGL